MPSGGVSLPVGRPWLSGVARPEGNEATRKVERSLAYMAENLDKPLQVATLAAQAKVSPSHFFALFKQMTGCPPIDYFTKLRMRHACRLLDSTTARVKEVAAALGYDDQFYFSRLFKSVNGVPPRQYRVMMAGRQGADSGASLMSLEKDFSGCRAAFSASGAFSQQQRSGY